MNQSLSSQQHLALQGSPTFSFQQATVDLNGLLQEVTSTLLSQNGQSRAIIRFDLLPEVRGNREQYTELFHLLFLSIVSHGSAASKPFIYIKTEPQVDEVMDLRFPADTLYHRISVYTNIAADTRWFEQHCADIDTMKTILNDLQGSLNCSAIEKTGCLYMITVPGKII